MPKTKGAYRTITVPSIRDVVVYRHLADEALRRAIAGKVKGAFFSRRFTNTPIGPTFDGDPDPYHKFFVVWLRYNQYRTRTLLNSPHDILVLSDITNYFDSIQHELLLEYLTPLGLPRKAVGLLGRILEAFKPRAGHSPNPRVGLPVDDVDCSRQFAHLFLFEHDRRGVRAVGEQRYVRWMDDQTIGTTSLVGARRVVNLLTRSLSQQVLTLNAGKTLFLDPAGVAAHFHLDANGKLDAWSDKWGYPSPTIPRASRTELRALWNDIRAADSAERGLWEKILKRVYGFAVQADLPDLESRAASDLVAYPELNERIFAYFALRDRGRALVDLFTDYVERGDNLFESTENAFFEAALNLRPTGTILRDLRGLALRHAGATRRRRSLPRAAALLTLYWLGASVADLVRLYTPTEAPLLPKEVARAWLAIVFALDPGATEQVRRALLGHPSDDVARLGQFLSEIESGSIGDVGPLPGLRARWPSPGRHFDARSWLVLEILSHSPNSALQSRVRSALPLWATTVRGNPERRIFNRISPRVMYSRRR